MDDTHLLKHIKQAILVWSFRQNTFLGSLLLKCSIWSCYAIAVVGQPNLMLAPGEVCPKLPLGDPPLPNPVHCPYPFSKLHNSFSTTLTFTKNRLRQ